jgi:hypothetical protein
VSTFLETRRAFLASLAAPAFASGAGDWIELFDGRTLDGWRASENKNSWQVRDGALAADGPRSHLFYMGPAQGADFRNFELEVEVLTRAGCNSGVYFHTRYQEKDFPQKGFEVQINNTASGEGNYRERKKTGSLYGLRNIYKQFLPDDQWFKIQIAVRGKSIRVSLNGMLTVDYLEPTPPVIPDGMEHERFLDHGTFALQCHNDGSRAFFRNVRVRPLPDKMLTVGRMPTVDEVYRAVINVGRHNVPMVDYHVNLNGPTLEGALQKSRWDGIEYGIVAAVDTASEQWVRSMQHQPVFLGMQGRAVSRRTAALFDYILSDSTTWTQALGANVNREQFMDALVARAVAVLEKEPIDIYASPTYLPARMAKDYDTLWTEQRMKKVIDAAARNQVAIEINNRYRIPSARFIRAAKAAGCKFCFGSNNAGASDLGRCEYGLQMLSECKLDWRDFFVPGTSTERAVERRGSLLQG